MNKLNSRHRVSKKIRIDELLVRRELAAQNDVAGIILAGQVFVDGVKVDKAGTRVAENAQLELRTRSTDVGRGAQKLAGALDDFAITVSNCICADVGACTGGFTQKLLQHGATRVYAIDVGYGALDYRLRKDSRVVVMERTNATEIEALPDPIQLVTIDVSFTSLLKVLPSIRRWLTPTAQIIALIKPQFEALREEVPLGGVVSDQALRRTIVMRTLDAISAANFVIGNLAPSRLTGGDGNQEYFALLALSGDNQIERIKNSDW